MKISARVENSSGAHQASVTTNGITSTIAIPPKPSGHGSSANGGELLFLALATCYCNDLYREAAKQGIQVDQVTVEVEGQFGAEGEPASDVTYHAKVTANAGEAAIRQLTQATDAVAEIQNSLRAPISVVLGSIEAISITSATEESRAS
jgi:organic hydroperoxide reductase OsmC/OhrA